MLRIRKFGWALSVLLAMSLVLTACGPKQPDAQSPADDHSAQTGGTSGEPAVGGLVTLRLDKDPDNMNPILYATAYGAEVVDLVYATLFEFNTNLEPEPYVAREWSQSEDGLTWTIKIKEGIRFHDGAELTAEDVAFTLGAIMHPDYTGPRTSSVQAIESVEATDKYTLTIKLKYPYAPLFEDINYGILQKKLFANTPIAELERNPVTWNPVGAGPYKFKEYKRGQYILLERNDEWFMSEELGGAPFIDTIQFKIIPEDATALAALEAGEIDHDTPDPKEVTRLLENPDLKPLDYERRGWGYITLNVSRPHLDNKLVRQALTYGLDRQSIIDGVMDGRAVVPAGPIPPVSWAFDPTLKPYPYDPEKAKQLLEQAGYQMGDDGYYYKDGQKLALIFYGSSGSPLIEGIAMIARQNWKQIGVELDVQLMDFNAMMENYVKPGRYDVSFSGFNLGYDPDMTALFHSSQVNGFNRARYANPRVDELLEAGVRIADKEERKQIYSEFQRVLYEDAPVIYIYANKYTDFVSSRLKGVVNFPGEGAAQIYKWWINEK